MIAKNRNYGDYEITLVFGNDYIPISNTIRYTLDDGYHFSEEYESIPLNRDNGIYKIHKGAFKELTAIILGRGCCVRVR